jgi:hypothetical protein
MMRKCEGAHVRDHQGQNQAVAEERVKRIKQFQRSLTGVRGRSRYRYQRHVGVSCGQTYCEPGDWMAEARMPHIESAAELRNNHALSPLPNTYFKPGLTFV